MVVTDFDGGLAKYTRVDVESLDWIRDNQIRVERSEIVKCIGSNVYVLSQE